VIVASGGEIMILKRISFPLSLRQKQPSSSNLAFFERTGQSLVRRQMHVKVNGHMFEHLL
jgi:hypothetical protein